MRKKNSLDKLDSPLRSCVCKVNESKKQATKLEVLFGLVVIGAVTGFLAFSGAPVPIFLVLYGILLAVIFLLAATRLAKGHSLSCSIRWGFISLLSISRWL